MLKVKSFGIDKLMSQLQSTKSSYSEETSILAATLAEKVKDKITTNYQRTRGVWSEEGGTMSEISGNDVTIRKDGGDYIVAIGEQTPKVSLSGYNGLPTSINPYLFVEFGFGIVGQNKPVREAQKRGWQYNVKRHTSKWTFTDKYGNQFYTKGVRGANSIGLVKATLPQLIAATFDEVNKNNDK